MPTQITIPVDGPFSLPAAASFGFGPNAGRPHPDADVMRLAFVADDLDSYAGAVVRQEPDGALTIELHGDASDQVAVNQIRRILSVDADVTGWLAAGQADPVLGRIQGKHQGLRPVLFHSPYEAAAWAVLSQRRQRAQATALRRRLSEAAGVAFELAGQTEHAFPLPGRLLGVATFPGIDEQRMTRLHGVARAALDGRLDVVGLRSMSAERALPWLQQINGLGPLYARLVYLRSTGVTDGLALGEPLLAGCLQHFYGLAKTPDDETIVRLAEPWRPFRTWAGVLFRVAGDRAGVPIEQQQSARRLARRQAMLGA
jgi:DNA-3-methyladenine glycosylase II